MAFSYIRRRLNKTRYVGSTCSGSDGTTGRTLTHTTALNTDHAIFINGRYMHQTDEYTISGLVITFASVAIDNSDIIVVMA